MSLKLQTCPTQRAADLGYAPRYLGVFLAGSFSRFSGLSPLPPQAANASRWAFLLQTTKHGGHKKYD